MRFFSALLVLFASLQLVRSADPLCENQGEIVNGLCACFSTFTGPTCGTLDDTCGILPTVSPLATQVVAEFQGAPQSKIQGNNFTFVVDSAATSGRYFSSISLNGNMNCSYPSANYVKTFAPSPACKDVFTGKFEVPALVDTCGFTESSVQGWTVLSGSVDVTAVDYITSFRGHPIFRTTSSSLALDLKLPTFVNLTTSQLSIFSPINVMAAVTLQEYDGQTDRATIEITTSVQWPFQLEAPSFTGQSPYLILTEITDDSCLQGSGDCLQVTTFSILDIQETSSCSFDGAYEVTFTYDCRAGQTPCPVSGADTTKVTFNLISGDICSSVEVVATIDGDLHSYSDNTFTTERLVIVAGERIFLKAALTSDVTIQDIVVHELRVVQGGVPKIIVTDDVQSNLFPTISYNGAEGSVLANEVGLSFLATSELFSSNNADAVFAFTVEADLTITYKTTFGRKRDTTATNMTFAVQAVLLKN